MATHGTCGVSWSGMRAEHCGASGICAFPLRSSVPLTHYDTVRDEGSMDTSRIRSKGAPDADGSESGVVHLNGVLDVESTPLGRMVSQVLLGGQNLQVVRAVVGGVLVDVVDLLAFSRIDDQSMLVSLDVLGRGLPAEPDVASGVSVAPRLTGWGFLTRSERTDGLSVRAKTLDAALVASAALASSKWDDDPTLNTDDIHGVIVAQWSCHETFTGRTSGDMHRVGPFDGDRRCLTGPEMVEAGLHLNDRGLWALPAAEDGPHWTLRV